MQVKAVASYETKDGSYTGRLILAVEWLPESEIEHVMLIQMINAEAHELATVTANHEGDKFMSTVVISDPAAFERAKTEVALFQKYKAAAEIGPISKQNVSFEVFKSETQQAAVKLSNEADIHPEG